MPPNPNLSPAACNVTETQRFNQDPLNWLKRHILGDVVIMKNNRYNFTDPEVVPVSRLVAGVVARSERFPEAFKFDAVVNTNLGLEFRVHVDQAEETGYRALPFKENTCTYLKLDAGARFFHTGPLSACHVYVLGDEREKWVFHVNANDSDDNLRANMEVKKKLCIQVANALGISKKSYGSLVRTEYSTLGMYGFVFGIRGAAGWAFYSYMRREADRAGGMPIVKVLSTI